MLTIPANCYGGYGCRRLQEAVECQFHGKGMPNTLECDEQDGGRVRKINKLPAV